MTFMSLEFPPIVRNEMDWSRGGVQHASHFTCGNCHEFLLHSYRKRKEFRHFTRSLFFHCLFLQSHKMDGY